MLDFEEFRFVAANAYVAVSATKNVATATTTTIVIILLSCIELLSYFIILVTRRYSKIYFFKPTAMTLLEYEVPTRDPFNGYIANALTLSADPNDNNKVWFTEFNHDKIGVLDSSPPIPFDIDSSASRITILSLSNNTAQKNASSAAATLNVEVTTKKSFNRSSFINNSNTNADNNRTLIFLNASSSMNPLGKFVNMTAKFYPTSIIELNKDRGGKAHSNMIFQRNGSTPISPGNYTLGISATNGIVTKSIFRYLFVK
ncbi:MAG: hypothetical protein M3044_14610 [Thermoproteota archaeon]|nr:hypothetical protein [Thermoproteota archaeon]